jgi:hypothetical protein
VGGVFKKKRKLAQDVDTIEQGDFKKFILNALKDVQVYVDPTPAEREKELKPAADKVFREICSCQNKQFDLS